MRLFFLFFILLFIDDPIKAQRSYTLDDDKTYIDSLIALIETTQSDSIKCLNSFKLSDMYRKSKEMELSQTYLKRANALADKFLFLKDIAIYYNATKYFIKGDIDAYGEELETLNEKLKKYSSEIAYTYRAIVIKNLSVIYQLKQNEKEAMRLLVNEGIPIAQKSKNREMLSNLYKMMGIIFMNIGERKKSNYYLELATRTIEGIKEDSYTFLESKLDAYIIHAENASALDSLVEAKTSLDKAYFILKEYPKSNLNSIFYYSQGYYFFKLKQYEASLISYDKSIENCKLHNDPRAADRAYFAKYKSLNALNNYLEARDLLIELVEEHALYANERKNFMGEIIKICKKINDTKNGYMYSLKYIQLSDSLHEIDTEKEIIELETKYNTVEKEKRINELESQKQRALLISQNNKLNYLLFGLLSFVLLLIVVFLWKYANTQKKLAIEKELNYKQNLVSLQHQKGIEVMQAMINAEEIERKRIARDLHDGIGSQLSALKMQFVNWKESKVNESAKEIETFTNSLNSSISELRNVAYNLLPETLLKLGLEKALHDLCYNLQTEKIKITFQANELKDTIIENNQITIFRIVQELVNNALKHANCSEIIVDCSQNKNLFLITVEDNGVGFDKNKLANYSGLGFKNLKNRVDILNGKLEIESELAKGTVINIELNIQLKA